MLNKIKSALPSMVNPDIPADLYHPINDLYLAFNSLIQQLNSASLVLKSPNGHYWVTTISNTGVPTWTDVGTTQP